MSYARGRDTDYLKLRQRKRLAREIIAMGGNLSDFAEAIGTSSVNALKYMDRNAPALRKALSDNPKRNCLSPVAVLNRLRTIAASKTQAEAARRLGYSSAAISVFIKRYAPDGVDDALADYEFNYGAPLFEEGAA